MISSYCFNKWFPVSSEERDLVFNWLLEKNGELVVSMLSDNKEFRFIFDSYLSYSSNNESDLLGLDDQRVSDWHFHFSKNSKFIEWFEKISANKFKFSELIHYSIYTVEECVDIIALGEPEVIKIKC